MGYLIGLRNLLPETTTRIQRANDEELSLQLAVMRRRRDEMEAYEDANGEGACMELEDPRMIELIELEAGRVTAEMITNACLAQRKPGLSYH
jgi:hypothetical protein